MMQILQAELRSSEQILQAELRSSEQILKAELRSSEQILKAEVLRTDPPGWAELWLFLLSTEPESYMKTS